VDQPFWRVIDERSPAAFVWVGDAIYADDRPWDGDQEYRHHQHHQHREADDDIDAENDMDSRSTTASFSSSLVKWYNRWFHHRQYQHRRRSRHKDATPEYQRYLYQQQRSVPGYKALLERGMMNTDNTKPRSENDTTESNKNDDNDNDDGTAGTSSSSAASTRPPISIFGTYDDHDYGRNNGDSTFPYKKESGIEYVTTFLRLNATTSAMARRAINGHGVYGVHVYDFSDTNRNRNWNSKDPTSEEYHDHHRHSYYRLLPDQEAGLDPDVVDSVDDKDDSADDEDNDNDNNNNSKDKRDGTTAAATTTKNRLVAVFVLDVRTNKTPWSTTFPQRFVPNVQGDFLGEKQWEWFETALQRSKAAINIIVSGIQIHAPYVVDGNIVENWSAFPTAQHRLYQTILRSTNVRAPILISGDVHLSQLLRKDCQQQYHPVEGGNRNGSGSGGGNDGDKSSPNDDRSRTVDVDDENNDKNNIGERRTITDDDDDDVDTVVVTTKPLYEITTSGMTHSWGSTQTSVCGRPNDHWLCTFTPFNAYMGLLMDFAHRVNPWNAILLNTNTDADDVVGDHRDHNQEGGNRRKGGGGGGRIEQYTLDRNIAELEFDWDEEVVKVRIIGVEGQTLLKQDWSFDLLSGSNGTANTMVQSKSFEAAGRRRQRQRQRQRQQQQQASTTFNTNGGSNSGVGVGNVRPSTSEDYICVNYRDDPSTIHVVLGMVSTLSVALFPIIYPLILLILLEFHRRRRRDQRQQNGTPQSLQRKQKNE
jgi:hypothetical protein